jgi:hypothetical protein
VFDVVMTGGDRVASRVRVAASACLVASGLFMAGAGGAIALADPGHGYGRQDRSDNRRGDDSIGDMVRHAFGFGDGNDQKTSEPAGQGPQTRWGNGRQGQYPGGKDPSETGTSPTQDWPTKESTTKPCPEPPKPTEPPGDPRPIPPQSTGGGGGGAIQQLPHFKPPAVPGMQLPDELKPNQPGVAGAPAVLDAGAGIAAAAPVGAAPIALPVIVVPPLALPGVAGGAGSGGGASAGVPPAAPRAVTAQPPAERVPPPASVGSNVAAPNSSYRIGYTEYLRTAGLPQVAALAVPGLVGIMVLTGAGGLLGFRQAKAGHAVHVSGSARFIR